MFFFLHYFIITISIFLSSSVMAKNSSGTINIGAILTAGNGFSWLSSSGDFALGFQQLSNNKDLYLLAIWFNKLPERTVVWSADVPNNPTPKGSKLELTAERGLLLTDPQKQLLWNSNPITTQVAMAIFNDTGNFVLLNGDSRIWESFDHPTDTLLPTQVLKRGEVGVSSRQSSTNFSSGRFRLSFNEEGIFALNSINLPSEHSNSDYYTSGDSSNPGKQLVFNESGSLYVLTENNEMHTLSGPESASTADYYHRATLNFDGVFTKYIHSKNPTKENSWIAVWSIPDNICLQPFMYGSSGACGYNKICRLGVDKRPSCECLRGFSLLDANDEYRGCTPNYFQSCVDTKSSAESLYTFQEMKDIDWPTGDYEILGPFNTDQCKEACLNDCTCAVAIYRKNACWKKRLPLTNGKYDPTAEATAFIKVRKSDFPLEIPSSSSKPKSQNVMIITGSALLGTSLFVNFLLVGAVIMGFFFIYKKKVTMRQHDREVSRFNLRCFTYKDLIDATDDFKEEIGRGSFSIVYKGTLKDTNDQVAVKKLERAFQDNEKEFKAEVNVIGHTHHKNLVRLLGFCEEGEQRLLVYEFMSNGSLAGFLFGDMRPSWSQRIQLATGVARGLLYLHEECNTQIIHCDIKPQNILLDESYNARIVDFGLAKLLLMNQSHTNTAIRGTKGYVAPEWFSNMPITAKVDVYSFGVLLLEIICCRRNVDVEISAEEKTILVYWAYDCYTEGAFDELVGGDVDAIKDMKSLERFLRVAIWCIQEDPTLRPSMKNVMLMLEGIVQVSAPPSPFMFGSTF